MKNQNQKRRVGAFLSPQGEGRWVPNGCAVTHSLCPRGATAITSVGTKNVPTLQQRQRISPLPLAGAGLVERADA
jgi:hypothetical protein